MGASGSIGVSLRTSMARSVASPLAELAKLGSPLVGLVGSPLVDAPFVGSPFGSIPVGSIFEASFVGSLVRQIDGLVAKGLLLRVPGL